MNDKDFSIIFYTSNREDADFEQRIQRLLLKMSHNRFPIISVSQKPIDFGDNICVGDVGVSDHNLYRQVLIACEAAKTPFVISAEADCLYTPGYFQLDDPLPNQVYRYNNVWVMKHHRSYFFYKRWSEGAQIIGREYYIDLLKLALAGKPEWQVGHFPTNPFGRLHHQWIYYGTPDMPVISIKTGKGLRANVYLNAGFVKVLPYWGTTKVVREKLGLA